MVGQRLRALQIAAATIAATLLLLQPASALPNEAAVMARKQEVADPAPSVWVSVDPKGSPHTFSPVVTEVGGKTTTISAPPSSLTKTATYTLSPSGQPSTVTGVAPVATAKDSNGEGLFLACEVYQGAGAPFCQPKGGSLLNPGKSYYITWTPSYFADPDSMVQFQADYKDGDSDGFTSDRIPASQGYFVWTIAPDFLTKQGHPSLDVSLFLAYSDDNAADLQDRVAGPSIVITNAEKGSDTGGGGSKSVSPAAIAVPIIVVVVLAILGAVCFMSWRRHGTLPLVGAIGSARRRSGSQGYGIRQSRSQRVGGGDGGVGIGAGGVGVDDKNRGAAGNAGGIQLTDRDSWSPTGAADGRGRNVFREEMERQQDRGR